MYGAYGFGGGKAGLCGWGNCCTRRRCLSGAGYGAQQMQRPVAGTDGFDLIILIIVLIIVLAFAFGFF